ncbi:hypothetical protein EYF80_016913 [Liparis tanakae]|uniref:Uncharacterized protein n=1 Tax=Liparis tanakae TaxID=230148 RepID=A0A4Z2I683_9TELE|nr:hypothetical protein EYF80_016913 [Liparis tanakae]
MIDVLGLDDPQMKISSAVKIDMLKLKPDIIQRDLERPRCPESVRAEVLLCTSSKTGQLSSAVTGSRARPPRRRL